MEFRILGPFEVVSDGHSVPLGGPKQRALLAALVVEANRVVTFERLIELVWGEESPDTARNVLQVYVSQLRKVLEAALRREEAPRVLVGRSGGYVLVAEPDQVDLQRFERLAHAGRQALADGKPAHAAATLREALALWGGPALADIEASFATAERVRLEELRLAALEDRIQADLDLGAHADVIAELHALVAQHPLRERISGQLMLALYRSARQADATEVFQRTRRRLVDELGLEPGPELQRLLTQILNQDPALALAPTQQTNHPTTTAAAPRTNLRLQLTSFIGREHEVGEVRRLLGNTRLLTLVGAGGVGKTRLALETAGQLLGDYRDGVWLVELAALADPSLVPQALASGIGVHEQPGRSMLEAVMAFLETRQLLLVVDNCEHLLNGCATVVNALLRSCAGIRVLATSRAPLHLDGEQEHSVPPLVVPDLRHMPDVNALAEYEAVALFIQRARMVRPDFRVTPSNAPFVAELCAQLDGLPLAIELAAAQVKVLPPEDLLARLGSRLALLTGGPRNRPGRQQTLRATLDWSYDLLGEWERILFRRLAVFAGGCSLGSVETVCPPSGEASTLEGIRSLLDNSLLTQAETPEGLPRFRFLETIREYAAERLERSGESESIHLRHAEHYRAMAEAAEPELRGPTQDLRLAELERDHDNLRAALRWSIDSHQKEVALRMSAALGWFWRLHSHFSEGLSWLEATLALSTPASLPARARALHVAGELALIPGNYEKAIAFSQRSVDMCRLLGDERGAAIGLKTLGVAAVERGDFAAARVLLEESRALYERLDDAWGIARALNNLGHLEFRCRDFEAARHFWEESLVIARRFGDTWEVAVVLMNLGEVERVQAKYERSAELLIASLRLFQQHGDQWYVAMCLEQHAALATATGRPDRGARLFGSAAMWRANAGALPPGAGQVDYERDLQETRDMLSDMSFAAAMNEGRLMLLDDAVEYALAALAGR